MKIHIDCDSATNCIEPRVGSVYTRRGGRAAKRGEMAVILHITEPEQYEGRKAVMLFLSKEGHIVGADTYCLSYYEEKCPIAFVEGIKDIDLTMRSL